MLQEKFADLVLNGFVFFSYCDHRFKEMDANNLSDVVHNAVTM